MRILYLDLDTLRADHLGCYGYSRNTSPNIDLICHEGVRFDNCYCSDAPCLPSRTALVTGRFGIHTGVVGHSGTSADIRTDGARRGFRDSLSDANLPEFLKRAGLHTAFIGGFGERHAAWYFYPGFREIHDTGKGGMESAEDVTPVVLDWIARNAARDNWYLHVNFWDPHTPYRVPAGFGNPFAGDPLPLWFSDDLIRRHRSLPGPHTAQDLNMYDNRTFPEYPRQPGEIRNMDDLRLLIDGYDCGIAYMDRHIGQILTALKAKGAWDDLAIIVSADHGENFGELGLYAEHATADLPTCRIPLIVKWPGGKHGHADSGLHYNLDLVPTLAALLDREPNKIWDGSSFASAVRQGEKTGRDYLALSQCAHVCQRSVRWKDWLYMHTRHDGYHLFPPEMLFNVKEDSHEQNDLAESHPDACAEGRNLLAAWHAQMMSSMPAGHLSDPMDIVLAEGGPTHAKGRLKQYCERLQATGRGYAVKELRRRFPAEFGG